MSKLDELWEEERKISEQLDEANEFDSDYAPNYDVEPLRRQLEWVREKIARETIDDDNDERD
jgi:hypothetical protein